MNMSGPVLSLSSVFMKWPRDTLLFLCYTGCFCEVSEAHLFIFPSILFQPSLYEGSSFFFVALYELLWKWKNRWSFIAILKKHIKGKWWMKKSLPELQESPFIGTCFTKYTIVTCTICPNGGKVLILHLLEIESLLFLIRLIGSCGQIRSVITLEIQNVAIAQGGFHGQ